VESGEWSRVNHGGEGGAWKRPLVVEVALVSNQYNGDPVGPGEVQYFLANNLGVLKALGTVDGIHDDISMNTSCVLRVHNGVFILGCVAQTHENSVIIE